MYYTPDIIVLEDTIERVKWLRATFPDVAVRWAKDVPAFLRELRRPGALLVLDHDLGDRDYTPAEYDAYGLTGMDAARACGTDTPVVVWSANPVWGPRMRAFLVDRGVPVVQYPFRAELNMALVIQEAYFHATKTWLRRVHV